jgi:hypothetical protein
VNSSADRSFADSSNNRTEPSAERRGDDRDLTEELEQKILPLLKWIQEEHGETAAMGERQCPFCGSKVRYRIANRGQFICCQCEAPDCFFLIT